LNIFNLIDIDQDQGLNIDEFKEMMKILDASLNQEDI
jgi:hypothetical protein